MFIIPFIHTNKNGNGNITCHIINILTQGGTALWEENDSINVKKSALLPNGLYAKNIAIFNNSENKTKYALCNIDIDKTNMNDFYKWCEVSPDDVESFCWRYFVVIRDENGHEWLPTPSNETIGSLNLKMLLSDILKDLRV